MANPENLRPWKPGQSGNPGGRPKKKPITEELERLLTEQAPSGDGRTWAALIAEALLRKASTGDVRAIAELTNRIEGKPLQSLTVGTDSGEDSPDTSAELLQQILLGVMTDTQLEEVEKQLRPSV
jgi:hypothetical protein